MAEAIVSGVLEQLISVVGEEIQQEMRLVGNVEKEVKQLRSNLEAIQAVLLDAEQRQVMETAVRRWLNQLKDTSYVMEDVLDEWNTAIMKFQIEGGYENNTSVPNKVCFFFPSPCFGIKQVVFRRDIALRIKEINENLDAIAKEKNNYNFEVIRSIEKPERVQSTSLVDVSKIYGRDDEKHNLVSKLLCESSEEQNGINIISIVGMGGIGKTTLAQFAYNNSEVIRNFEKRIWICVSDPFDEFKIAKAIIEALEGRPSKLVEFNSLIQKIHDDIEDKKFLIVLDDVWTEDYDKWKPFHLCLKNGLHGSKILITTRKLSVAHMMESFDIINISELSQVDCWSLFSRFAFLGRSHEECEKLEEIGKKIVEKCKGLPLAVKTMGSLLRFKKTREEWSILDDEMWKLKEFEKSIFPPLLLSYNDLPSMVKRCFSYCSIYPKDYDINKDELIKLWMAQGYLGLDKNIEMELIGQEYFDHLATRSFFQEFKKDDDDNVIMCKMHDIVHDFAQFVSNNECLAVEVHDAEEPFINPSHVKVCHSMLTLKKGAEFPKSILSVKWLRSLLFYWKTFDVSQCSAVLSILCQELLCLRALHISESFVAWVFLSFKEINLQKIPNEIGKLIHLRYLNLSFLYVDKLPETLCELYNLQTLNLNGCFLLPELPKGIGKLINLRHLMIEETGSLIYLPIGIAKLTCLRTLSKFIVGGEDVDDSEACTLECLKYLNHLRGNLLIIGLRRATNVSEIKGLEALKNKENLRCLDLIFDDDTKDKTESERINEEENKMESERMKEDDELLLEGLQLPPNLEKLIIRDYRGYTLPSNWMILTKLRKVQLRCFNNCKHLSPLGKLSSLESLKIYDMSGVKSVDNEFLGVENNATSSSSSVILFPKLKHLKFTKMRDWEVWDYGEETNTTIMPCLASLKINSCDKLIALPDSLLRRTTLETLMINGCPILQQLYAEGVGEEWPKISHIPDVIVARF